MKIYSLLRSDIFCFEETAELIVHLPDFALAELKPTAVSISGGGVKVPMQVIGMGNQQGKLAVRLAATDTPLFVKLRDALPDDHVVLSARTFAQAG